ncbi:MAG: hypothetical protein NT169_21095 [Chloroflexi bacterium]|nr:hypothetical protein [Chloroflexota bacterium]
MTDSVTTPTVPTTAARPALFPTLHPDDFKPLELCFGILLALATNCWRQRTFAPGHLRDVIRAIATSSPALPTSATRRPSWNYFKNVCSRTPNCC